MSSLRETSMRSAEWISELIVPGLRNSQFRYRDVLERHVHQDSRWLDIGCGHDIIPAWIPSSKDWQTQIIRKAALLIGIDGDLPSLRQHSLLRHKVLARANPMPFKDSSFTLVTLNMVAEHFQEPLGVFEEIFRVLKDAGIVIIHTPNRFSYRSIGASLLPQWVKLKLIKFFEDREEGDVFPTFYRFNQDSQIGQIAVKSGFEILDISYEETTPVASVLGPVVLPELLFLRLLRFRSLRKLRGDLIVILQKGALQSGD